MLVLTEDAQILCMHGGSAKPIAKQILLSINRRRVLVQPEIESAPILACPNINPQAGIKPCTTTLPPQPGYSLFVRVNGRPVCLDHAAGLTDGAPPGHYSVASAGQMFVDVRG